MLTYVGHQVKGEESQTAEVVNVEALLPQDRDYLTYQVDIFTWTSDNHLQGSFTTHGFAEGVTWLVLANPISVSSATRSRFNLRFISLTRLCWPGCGSFATAAPPAPG